MNRHRTPGKQHEKPGCAGRKEIRNLAGRVQLMSVLLYEVKAGTPLGRLVTVLLNLGDVEEILYKKKEVHLNSISLTALASLTRTSAVQVYNNLHYLERQELIIVKNWPPR